MSLILPAFQNDVLRTWQQVKGGMEEAEGLGPGLPQKAPGGCL